MNLPFRRKQDTVMTGMAPEVQQYYEAEHRQSTGVAWLLSIVTLLVTVLVIMLLFFGGRWVIRKLNHYNAGKGKTSIKAPSTKTGDGTNGSGSSSPSSPAATPNSNTGTSSTNTSTPNSSTTPSASTPSATAPTTSTSGSSASSATADPNLPKTGPGDTLAVFVAASTLAYIIHRKFGRQE